ncbi:hypothetical protein [Maribellus mangrovi]|uniref:hypothetical protein n=1 Tax=Maribellus mangrovi TaxID=3133146 RepID=UPI0030EDB535
MEDFRFSKEIFEEIINWTLPGLTMYYRDSLLTNEIITKYQVGQIIRSRTFVDVSSFAGRLAKNCRFIFATNKAAPLYQFNPDTERWKLHTINANSYFKVLDIYQKVDKIQFLLIHIPAKGIDFFKKAVIRINGEAIEREIIQKSRISFDQKMELDVIPELEEQEWINRTSFPIGLDNRNDLFPLYPVEDLIPQAVPLYDAIFKMTNDTELNIAKPIF